MKENGGIEWLKICFKSGGLMAWRRKENTKERKSDRKMKLKK